MFITHNLGVIAEMAEEIVVMYLGKQVERAKTVDMFYDPKHPYTARCSSQFRALARRPASAWPRSRV
jgi:peptide/nickel transport system ATP-binding protein